LLHFIITRSVEALQSSVLSEVQNPRNDIIDVDEDLMLPFTKIIHDILQLQKLIIPWIDNRITQAGELNDI
jgi:hypothetical protein